MKEIKIKITIKYHFTHSSLAKIQKFNTTKCCEECGVIGTLPLGKCLNTRKAQNGPST